jgi:tetratricopeptide (TPR) repeat protein
MPATTSTPTASALDLQALWNFRDPALSEQRFRDALATASSDDALILQTQIARTHTLRREFDKARELLATVQPALASASAEARVRHALEWGRCFASGTHRKEELTDEASAQARQAWQRALALARSAALDALAIDAIHMFAFIDTAPARQQHWAEQALAVVLASKQPAAQRWEASVRNNLGYALQLQGRHADAGAQYSQALALRRQAGNAHNTLVAGYMVARSLRLQGRDDEALPMQQQLLRDSEALGAADPYVLDELELLYRARGDAAQADAAAERARRVRATAEP